MTKYRIHYYNPKGHSMVFRDMFHIAGVQYEDVFYENQNAKDQMLFDALEVDGELIPQSGAIHRYLADQFGLYGANRIERAWADAYADLFHEFQAEVRPWALAVITGQGDKEELRQTAYAPGREKYFKFLTQKLEKSSTGFLLDSGLSYPDLVFYETARRLTSDFESGFIGNDFPKVAEYFNNISEHPKFKPYLQTRS